MTQQHGCQKWKEKNQIIVGPSIFYYCEYSGTSIQGTPSGPREVSLDGGWGLLIIKQQVKYFYSNRKKAYVLTD